MNDSLQKFRALLQELFQTENHDLEFGLYRVLKAERDHINRFLDSDLEAIVAQTLEGEAAGKRAGLETQLADIEAGAKALEVDPQTLPKWKAKKAELDAVPDLAALEIEIYNALAEFFGRYYESGDFLSRPRFKKDVYALPYNGEETKLHWANADQYYIKSARVLDAFSFESGGQKITFQVLANEHASENTKENRHFVLARDQNEQPKIERNDALGQTTIFFEFKKPATGEVKASDAAPLLAPIVGLDEEGLAGKLRNWARRKDFDFFVHKNLRGFLERELEWFLKNEVVSLDSLTRSETEFEAKTLKKARAIWRVGEQIIAFLASLEELQKRLWLKQKWVTSARLILPLGAIPDSLRAQVLENDEQKEAWQSLLGFPPAPDAQGKLDLENAQWPDDLPVDTAILGAPFEQQLLSELSKTENLDEKWNGIAFNADNFAALQLMKNRFGGEVKCVYIDPPYNTGGDGFLYKDAYQHSSWLSMMENRLGIARELMSDDGAIFVSIDENENQNLRWSLENTFGEGKQETVIVRANSRGQTYRDIAKTHEYLQISLNSFDGTFAGLV